MEPVPKVLLAAVVLISTMCSHAVARDGEAAAAPAPTVVVRLSTGEILKGVLSSAADADPLVIQHPAFGPMSVARSLIAAVEMDGGLEVGPPPPGDPAPASPEADAVPAPAPAEPAPASTPPTPPAPPPPPAPTPPAAPAPASPAPPPPPEIGFFDNWTGTVEAGFNTASGNSDRLAARFGLGLRRQTPDTITTINTSYNMGRNNDGISENRGRVDGRNEWIQQSGSGWRYFIAGSGEYERFQPWDWRASVNGGLGYDFIKDDVLTLVGRAGFGGSREYGRLSRGVRAEITPGLDLQWKIDERSKFTAGFDYYRDLDEFDVYRFVLRAAYDVLLDSKSNLSLRVGIEDRYDETAVSPRSKNDFELYTALVVRF